MCLRNKKLNFWKKSLNIFNEIYYSKEHGFSLNQRLMNWITLLKLNVSQVFPNIIYSKVAICKKHTFRLKNSNPKVFFYLFFNIVEKFSFEILRAERKNSKKIINEKYLSIIKMYRSNILLIHLLVYKIYDNFQQCSLHKTWKAWKHEK